MTVADPRRRAPAARRRRARPVDRTAAARQRRKRRREREGTRPVQIEVDHDRALSAIKRRDGLSELEAEALAWAEIEREVQAVWDDWLRRWAK